VIHFFSEDFRKKILEQYVIIEENIPAIKAMEKK